MASPHQSQKSCCDSTPLDSSSIWNRSGLEELKYRVAVHSDFKTSMRNGITGHPALRPLSTRDDHDATLALIDSWAMVLDVLTFYQERIANEGYLRTSTERRSVLELARSIGYELNPGVAASSYCVFYVETATGSSKSVRLDPGIKIQSIPGQDETPQIFETTKTVTAYGNCNRIAPRLLRPTAIKRSTVSLYLEGTTLPLEKGSKILLVGKRRETSPFSERWDVRTISKVEVLHQEQKTRIQWIEELGHVRPRVSPADSPRVYTFRKKASLFGYNAPDFKAMPESIKNAFDPTGASRTQWPHFKILTTGENRIDLDSEYTGIVEGSWVLLEKPTYTELYKAVEVFTDSRTDYTLTAKTTSLILDTRKHLNWFGLRNTTVFAGPEELTLAEEPVTTPVYGDTIELDNYYPELEPGRTLILSASPLQYVQVASRTRTYRSDSREIVEKEPVLILRHLSSAQTRNLQSGEMLKVVSPPLDLPSGKVRWFLATGDRFEGYVDVDDNDLRFPAKPVDKETEEVTIHEIITVKTNEINAEGMSVITLEAPLSIICSRQSVILYGNVLPVSHGETKNEIIGSGDQSKSMQTFSLYQKPLTYVSSASANGAQSTLSVRVNGIEWKEVDSLYGQAPDAQIFQVRHAEDDTVSVQFGDNTFGSKLPTGRDTVSASYRVGIGMDGMVREKQLSLLMTRPLGLKEAFNPVRASGAQDPELQEDAKMNAPRTVLTMDRIVSVQDFEDFTRGFAGIGKAQAAVIWNGYHQTIHLTIAGSDGLPLDQDTQVFKNLMTSLNTMRHNDYPVFVDSLIKKTFSLSAGLHIDSRYEIPTVLDAVKNQLLFSYAFENRSLSMPVTLSDLVAVIHLVDGVQGVTITELNGTDPVLQPMIPASGARWDSVAQVIIPAELLIIDPNGIQLEESMS
jgi:hypothetical protein